METKIKVKAENIPRNKYVTRFIRDQKGFCHFDNNNYRYLCEFVYKRIYSIILNVILTRVLDGLINAL